MAQDARDLSEFENPVWREISRRTAGEKELGELCDGFMTGDWSVFGMVAPLVIAGRSLRAPDGEASPHARFWSQYTERATEDEKRAFVGFLLRAQLANPGMKHRPGRVQAGGFTNHCRQALIDYLSSFESSVHDPDPQALLGARLTRYGHIPDERMVQLAGMYAVAEAVPALERLLGITRRFHQLHVDYCTRPNEVDSVFREAVRALVRIALSEERERERVLGILRSAAKKAKGEKVWFEVLSHNNYTGDMSQHVDERDVSEIGMPSKADILGLGIKAIEGEGEERRAIEGAELGKEPYSWVIPGPDGGGKIVGDRLYMLGDFKLEALDIATGRAIFMIELGMSNSTSGGVGCYYPTLAFTEYGAPILVTLLDDRSANLKEWHAITFDLDTGEVTSMFKLCHQPVRAWGPEVWPRPDGGIVFRMREERRLWKQDKDGNVVWKKDLEEWDVVRCCLHRVAIFNQSGLVMLHAENGKTRVKRTFKGLLTDAGAEGTYRDDLVITEDGFFLITREGDILYFDHHGQFLWKRRPEVGGSYLTELRSFMGGLVGENNDHFYRITKDGDVSHFEKPDRNIKARLVNSHGAFFMLESYGIVEYRPFDADATRELITDLPIVRSMVDLSDDFFVIRFFEDAHHWACLPRDRW